MEEEEEDSSSPAGRGCGSARFIDLREGAVNSQDCWIDVGVEAEPREGLTKQPPVEVVPEWAGRRRAADSTCQAAAPHEPSNLAAEPSDDDRWV